MCLRHWLRSGPKIIWPLTDTKPLIRKTCEILLIFEKIITIRYNRVSITGCGWSQILKLLQKTQSSRESNLKQSFVQIFAIQNAKKLNFLKNRSGASFGPSQKIYQKHKNPLSYFTICFLRNLPGTFSNVL